MLNILDAAMHVAHDFDGGIPALAQRLDVSPNVLQKQFDPKCDTHHLKFETIVKTEIITGDYRALHAHAAALGHLAIKIPDVPEEEGDGLFDGVMDMTSSHGDVIAEFKRIFADRKITKAELPAFNQRIYQHLVEIIEFQRQVLEVAE